MRRLLLLRSLISLARPRARFDSALAASLAISSACLVFSTEKAHAQDAGTSDAAAEPPAAEPESAAEPASPAEPEGAAEPEPTAEPQQAGPVLEPPSLTPLELDPATAAAGASTGAPKPPPAMAPIERKGWTAPETVFHLHGYMRMRGTLLKDGALGHTGEYDRLPLGPGETGLRANYDPFLFFKPGDSSPGYKSSNNDGANDPTTVQPVTGGCGDNYGNDGSCKKKTQVGGDMRLRLKPEIHLSDDVRVKAWVDVLDNVGLGTLGYGPNNTLKEVDLGNSLRVRRAWGEARNRDIGELRFGRMGADWGLGILDNGGDRNGIDSDFSSDVDRVMGITNLAGFYLMAAYDWASQGKVLPGSATPSGVIIDRSQRDDVSAMTLAAAHRLDADLQRSTLQRGESVFNYGAYFIYRRQLLKNSDLVLDTSVTDTFVRVDQTQFVPDLWLQFLWEGLRVELEGAFVAGALEGACPGLTGRTPTNASEDGKGDSGRTRSTSGECKFRQLGVALETEYKLFDDRLGIHFNSGFASGDNNSYGLAQTNDPSLQRDNVGNNSPRTLSTYQFHPDYRVDLILWRTLMRRVAGGYYFKPGVSYDFIHDPYGQQAGARLDVIYSRASAAKQAYGNSGNLGLELDVSLYYRSEDGPDVLDGFYTTLQWGILFPFQGLDYANGTLDGGSAPSSKNAMILRGAAGIAF